MGLLVTSNRYTEFMSDAEFNDKFYYYLKKNRVRSNPAGYGPGRPYVPPLENPQTLLAIHERHELLMETGKQPEFSPFLNLSMVWRYFIKEIGFTFFVPERTWYDYYNATAYGNHVYPSGIHKYYDMYSLDGYWRFFNDYLLALLILEPIQLFFWFLYPLNQIPIEVWYWMPTLGIGNFEQIIYILATKYIYWWAYPVLSRVLAIPTERGFYYEN